MEVSRIENTLYTTAIERQKEFLDVQKKETEVQRVISQASEKPIKNPDSIIDVTV